MKNSLKNIIFIVGIVLFSMLLIILTNENHTLVSLFLAISFGLIPFIYIFNEGESIIELGLGYTRERIARNYIKRISYSIIGGVIIIGLICIENLIVYGFSDLVNSKLVVNMFIVYLIEVFIALFLNALKNIKCKIIYKLIGLCLMVAVLFLLFIFKLWIIELIFSAICIVLLIYFNYFLIINKDYK